ncbi:phospholipid-translocating ATPase rsb1 [Cladophialophora chaetospira]|uniref:Phospholipid-translocating ATPase rsb1 n=1 Tax=Cladophialophora chaetospira TaxID=386627 RepID=A0AA39CJG2_9EURO|nr:phospholipid-translocating ATPase rsb1 [Cladophialophora chaetospira]
MSNSTFDPKDCTLATCSVKEYGQIQYIPSLPGNVIYTSIFGVLLASQLFLGIKHKTYGYMVGMAAGLLLELLGYVGRLMLHNNIFDKNSFIIYLIGLTIGPAFLTASIYLCLSRIITIYSVELSLLKPKWITLIFVFCDFISLLLQAAGGAIASTSDDDASNQTGVNVMIAGLASQVISLVIFASICGHFAWRVLKNPSRLNHAFLSLRMSRRFKGMLIAIAISTLTILVRSVYRLAELQQGFDGKLANNELEFMILEGPMIFIAVALLTIWHPGYVLGTKLWNEAGFHLRKQKKTLADYKEVDTSSQEAIAMEQQNADRMV